MIDEVEGFLEDRRGAQRAWEVTQVNELLTQMESFPGIFFATTNLMPRVDQAALRRFDLKACLDYLSADQAWALFCMQCKELELGCPSEAAEQEIRRLRNLAPGDFAAVNRQSGFQPIDSPDDLCARLRAESQFKEVPGSSIGFR